MTKIKIYPLKPSQNHLTCGISSALDGSEDHLIHEKILKDINNNEGSTCADLNEDIDELDPLSDTED